MTNYKLRITNSGFQISSVTLLFFFTFLYLIHPTFLFAQNKYLVFFKDKPDSYFNPFEYFDQKAIERRVRQHIPLNDYTDWPVNEKYICDVSEIVDSIGKCTRWLNAVVTYATPDEIKKVKNLPFVDHVEYMGAYSFVVASIAGGHDDAKQEFKLDLTNDEKELLIHQTTRMGAIHFKEKGIDGSGIRIAVFDVGFPSVDTHPAFGHLRKNGKIIKTYDFVADKDDVFHGASHGTEVLSCIAGKLNDHPIGLATGSEFLLARTERMAIEVFAEEENWLSAAEWADKNGVDIINSSLGYTSRRYFNSEMDGHSTLVSRAATMAASKGILVVNAAGNEGSSKWHIIAAPADADSVLSVGGIDPYNDYHVSFSSYGPTADKRIKPNVSAMGIVIAANPRGITQTQGTSFSSPLVAGFTACAWQMKRNLTNMELFKEIEHSANLFPYFDYAHGFGVPQANYFTNSSLPFAEPNFEFITDSTTLQVVLKENMAKNNPYHQDSYTGQYFFNEQSDLDIKQSSDSYHLYYHIKGADGVLKSYYVVTVEKREVLSFLLSEFEKGDQLVVHYHKYTATYEIK